MISDINWPSHTQMDAAAAAIAQHANVGSVHLQLIAQLDWLVHGRMIELQDLVSDFCARLAASCSHITKLELSACEQVWDVSDISQSVGKLASLQHLTFSSGTTIAAPSLAHLSSLACLTALELYLVYSGSSSSSLISKQAAVQQVLQPLAELSLLQSLTLQLPSHSAAEPVTMQLTAWPHLRHLTLTDPDSCLILQLSLQHCAQLDSLHCSHFQPPADTTSMAQLKQLAAQGLKQQPSAADAAGGPAAAHVSLQYPKLQSATIDAPARSNLLSLTSAPALQELHLLATPPTEPAAAQELWHLLAQLPSLRSLSLPQEAGTALMQQHGAALLAHHSRLQHLRPGGWVPPALHPVLAAYSTLRELHLEMGRCDPAVLLHLPPQLTALTYISSAPHAAAGAAMAMQPAARVPPLRRLRATPAQPVLQALPLAQLTGLTSLSTQFAPLGSAAASISSLSCLVELDVPLFRGMAQQLVGLRDLRRLTLSGEEPDLMGQEGGEVLKLSVMTELRGLVLATGRWEQMKLWALQLARALPCCVVKVWQ